MFMDLDGFKRVNDTLGHPAGDELLQQVARRLLQNSRPYDTIARLGGDEFTIVLEDMETKSDVSLMAQRILKSLAVPFHVGGQDVFLTASIGISVSPQHGSDVTSLMKHADIAMYQAKKAGGNKFRFYLARMTIAAEERLALETDLRQAMDREEFEVYFQPQVSLKTSQIVGLEALLRWNHPQHGLKSPDAFIPVAEESGLIQPIGEWVLHSACAQNKAWQDETGIKIPVAVNVSGRQINEQLVRKVGDILRATGLEPRYLELEITESCIMDQATTTIASLNALRKLGVILAIDDFGTGYSSMNYLKRLPINVLKIDRSFVNDIPKDSNDAGIVKAILALGKTLNLSIVAEGVETEEQRAFLAEHGCDAMQGYLFSEPLPAHEIMELFSVVNPSPNQIA
jgi:diguanylate cyclase (GGDEF)-like protein